MRHLPRQQQRRTIFSERPLYLPLPVEGLLKCAATFHVQRQVVKHFFGCFREGHVYALKSNEGWGRRRGKHGSSTRTWSSGNQRYTFEAGKECDSRFDTLSMGHSKMVSFLVSVDQCYHCFQSLVSNRLLCFNDGHWLAFIPDADHPKMRFFE